jgi:GT2 family glycosyltransferase
MVASEYPSVLLVPNRQNVGFAAATNQGLRQARGRYLLLLNPDAVVHEDVLHRSVTYMDNHTKVGMMGCKVLNEDGTTQMTCSRYPSLANLILQTLAANRISGVAWLRRYQMLDWDRNDEREVEIISGCYLLVRRETLADIRLLDETFFLYGEETDWCRRCAEAGWKLVFAPVGAITHFGSGSSRQLNFRRDLLLSEGTVRLHHKHGGLLAAAIMWLLLLTFNCSRSIYWSMRAWRRGQSEAVTRAEHFRQVVRNFLQAWPTGIRRVA